MSFAAGYWVDLANVRLEESTTATWVQFMPLGTYEHPVHGKIDITYERAQRFAANVNSQVRGQELDIDYDHKEKTGEAAGWVKKAEARADGLWGLVEWTQDAYDKIKKRAYKYFSPEFNDEWTHPKTKQTFQDVLFGGALTNRPFLKDILPINMSEVFANAASSQRTNEGGNGMGMTPEQVTNLANKLGLGDDATETDVINELVSSDITVEKVEIGEGAGAVPAHDTVSASEEIKKLAESNPVVKQLMETVSTQARALAEVQSSLKLAEVEQAVVALSDRAREKKVALAPTTLTDLKETLLGISDKKLSETIIKGWETIIDAKVVELSERGNVRTPEQRLSDNSFMGQVKKLQEANPTRSYADIVGELAKNDPAGYAEYTQSVYTVKED